MSPTIVIGGLFETGVLALWWMSSRRAKQNRNRRAAAMEREIADLRHALSEMAMENHEMQDVHKRRRR
jgi:hypothetical protein